MVINAYYSAWGRNLNFKIMVYSPQSNNYHNDIYNEYAFQNTGYFKDLLKDYWYNL